MAQLLLELEQVFASGLGFQVARVFLSVLQSLLLHYLVELLDLFLLVGLPHFLLDQEVFIRLSFRSDLFEKSVVVDDFLNGLGILNMNAVNIYRPFYVSLGASLIHSFCLIGLFLLLLELKLLYSLL